MSLQQLILLLLRLWLWWFRTKTLSNWYWSLLFHCDDNFWLLFSSKLLLVLFLTWLHFFCLLFFCSSMIVVSSCVFIEMNMLLSITEDCVLLRFLAKPFFVPLLDGLWKLARQLKCIGSAFLQTWSTRSPTLLMCWAIASEWLQTEYSL